MPNQVSHHPHQSNLDTMNRKRKLLLGQLVGYGTISGEVVLLDFFSRLVVALTAVPQP